MSRRLTDRLLLRLAVAVSWGASLVVAAAVLALVGFLVLRGLGAVDSSLFFGESRPVAVILGRAQAVDGIWPACLGTLVLLALSSAMAVPLGVASGVYLSEYATGGMKRTFGFCVDLLAAVPSVVMGLFGFTLILLLRRTILPGATTCLLLAAFCLALLVLPYLVAATRTSLEGLPEQVRLLGPSLGLSRWQSIRHILLPAASRSVLGGMILSMGRAAEDTAVILLTGVVADAGGMQGLTGKFQALPFTIYYLAAQYQTPRELDRGFGAALVLLCLTAALAAGAHILHASLERKWTMAE